MKSVNYRSIIKRDYKLPTAITRQLPVKHRRRVVIIASVLSVAGIISLFSNSAPAVSNTKIIELPLNPETKTAQLSTTLKQTPRVTQSLPLLPAKPIQAPVAKIQPAPIVATQTKAAQQKRIKLKNGDSLAAVFSRNHYAASELHAIMALGKPTRDLRRIRAGQHIILQGNSAGKLTGLIYERDRFNSLKVSLGSKGFTAKELVRKPEIRTAYGSGEITQSLFVAGKQAGLETALVMDLANIFGWDIDFALDIRQGDKFRVVYETQYLDGEKVRNGNILAAEFINKGKTYRAVRYVSANGHSDYYSPDGRNTRKAFLRTPVDFRRISSRFGKRKHPVLKGWRLHRGVDYVAKRGTPIRATGDGKIIHRGRKGGYGKTVIIRHGGKYSTLYAHMSSYNRKARHGSKVKQGQVIGYVGATGRVTGTHLHYEFRVNGVHRNPLTVKLPSASSINKRFKQDFLNQTRGLLAQLDGLRSIDVATLN